VITGYLQQVQDSVTGIRCEYVTVTPLNPPVYTQTSPNLSGPSTIVPGSYAIVRVYTDEVPPDPDVGPPGPPGPAGPPGTPAVYSDDTPQPLGTASAGDVDAAARANHVHEMPSAADVGAPTVADLDTVSDTADAAQADAAQALVIATAALSGVTSVLVSCGVGDVVGACVRITGTKVGSRYPVTTVDVADPASGIAVGIISAKTSSTEGTVVLRGPILGHYVALDAGKMYVIDTAFL
jgi:hypothetical protein